MMEHTYKIGEAAEILKLKSYVLRFWETEFTQLQPIRTEKGQRLYRESDLDLLKFIRCLLHERGLTIEGARKILASGKISEGELSSELLDDGYANFFADGVPPGELQTEPPVQDKTDIKAPAGSTSTVLLKDILEELRRLHALLANFDKKAD